MVLKFGMLPCFFDFDYLKKKHKWETDPVFPRLGPMQ